MSRECPALEVVVPLPRIAELDGLRGIAILLVFGHHITMFDPAMQHPALASLLQAVFFYGHHGVDLFFVLSGFLITSILFEQRRQPSAFYRTFYWKRALRILPLYLLVLGLMLLFVPESGPFVGLAALFLANFAGAAHLAHATPFWTLAVEEQFYLLWPLLMRRRPVEQVQRLALGVAAGCFALRWLFALTGHHNYQLTFLHCDGLALGAVLACQFQQGGLASPHTGRLLQAAAATGCAAVALARLLPAAGAAVPWADDLGLTGATLASGAAVGWLIRQRGSRTTAWLRTPGLCFFGVISYAFYLIHRFVQQAWDAVAGASGTSTTTAYLLRFAAVFILTTGLSLLARHAVELPALSLRTRILLGRPPASAAKPQGALAGA